ncbi:MAG: hypothetical protein E7H34_07850 [Bifidobacterium pseudocatenulatum]|nr:hypothetical protein [Bifidobacterium pseudocatenulatum]
MFNPAGYDISVYPISTKEDRRTFFENLPIRRNADAVIIPSFDIDPDEASRLQSANLPLVGINALPESAFTLSVSIDDEQAMRLATRYLRQRWQYDIRRYVRVRTTNVSRAVQDEK